MPGLLYGEEQGRLYSQVVTGWDTVLVSEEYRPEAREFDALLSDVLDEAADRSAELLVSHPDADPVFARAWAVGASLNRVDLRSHPAMRRESESLVWRLLAAKCRYGARSEHRREDRWRSLRPMRAEEPRREGRRLDHFAMCRWLAEQSFEDADATFGGHVRNVWQMLERASLRPLVLREAFLRWLQSLSGDRRRRLLEPREFPTLMKALQSRWPARGPGSARKPIHYPADELEREMARVLAPCL